MLWFNRKEKRSAENPTVPISDTEAILHLFGLDAVADADVNVTIETALTVPAVWCAVNFLSATMASLPLHVYKKTDKGRERVEGGVASLLHGAVNDETSSFEWRKYNYEQVFTGGRGVTFIERNLRGAIVNLHPLDPDNIKFKTAGLKRVYDYKDGARTVPYQARDVIDIPFMLKANRRDHRSPVLKHKNTIGLAIAATRYGSRFFAGGGVPPFAIEGPFQSPGAMQRAADDLTTAVAKAAKEKRQALSIPAGHKIHNLGIDPDKSQLVELQKFIIEEVARIYQLPPAFLQDLTHGTFSNTEQQDLHLVKHTIRRHVTQFEQESNLKLFGRNNTDTYVEMNLDGLLRGDFMTRMQGYAHGIQNAVLKPNEARRRENLTDDDHGDDLMIQGATVPVKSHSKEDKPDEG